MLGVDENRRVVDLGLEREPWRPWFAIYPETVFNQKTPVSAVARKSDQLDLFKVGFDGAVWSAWWHEDDQGWRPWFQIHPETVFAQECPVTAIARRSDQLDLFTTGFDGRYGRAGGTMIRRACGPGSRSIRRRSSVRTRPVAAVARTPEHVDLFRVEWVETRPLKEAAWRTGLFTNQIPVCKLRDRDTIEFLEDAFALHPADSVPETPPAATTA